MDTGRWTALCALVIAAVAASPAQAAFPGDNGRLTFSSSNQLSDGDPVTGQRTNFTSGPGDVSPAWSPDGARLAFASARDGSQDIWVMRADGTGLVNVTNGSGSVAYDEPAWSYDGERLAFVGRSGIETATADGGGRRAIGVVGSSPAWEPGDATLLYDKGATSAAPAGIYRVSAAGGASTLVIPDGLDPDVSPDGREVAYRKQVAPPAGPGDNFGLQQILAFDLAARTSRPLSPARNSAVSDPAWSPDATRITWVETMRSAGRVLYVADADGTGANQTIFPSAGYNSGASWQPIARSQNHDPDCSTVGRGPWELGPANHKFQRVVLFGGDDPDGDRTWIDIDDVTQDEPLTGRGDNTRPDALRTGADNIVRLRAERHANGDGRVYTIKFTLYDERGGSCRSSVTVSVRRHRHRAAADSAHRYSSFDGKRISRRR